MKKKITRLLFFILLRQINGPYLTPRFYLALFVCVMDTSTHGLEAALSNPSPPTENNYCKIGGRSSAVQVVQSARSSFDNKGFIVSEGYFHRFSLYGLNLWRD